MCEGERVCGGERVYGVVQGMGEDRRKKLVRGI